MLRILRSELTVLAAAAAMALCSSGCTSLNEYVRNGFKVGPNYCKPPATVAEHWIDSPDERQESEDLSQWWTVFKDPVLDRLIACAYRQNLTLREAGFRVLQARAQRGIAVGEVFPQSQNAFASYSRQAINQTFSDQWNFGFGLAWELDFWGRFRRAVASADDLLDASVEDYDYVLVTLLADVAANYVQIRTAQEQMRYVEKNVTLQKPLFEYWEARAKVGFGQDPRLNLDQTQSLVMQTQAQIPAFEIQMRQANDRLCILLGIPPVDLREALDFWKEEDLRKREEIRSVEAEVEREKKVLENLGRAPDLSKTEETRKAEENETSKRIEDLRRRIDIVYVPAAPKGTTVAGGIPAQLLLRRPDVRRAERQAAAQAELIGIAQADFYPAISINGTLGWQARSLGQLFTSQALNANIGPSLLWNILNYGRIINNVRLQDATFQELVVTYQNTVLRANAEVEDGLVSFSREQRRAEFLGVSVRALSDAVDYMEHQRDISRIDVARFYLVAKDLFQQDELMIQAHGQTALGLIQVYRALGGGWQIRLESPEVSPAGPAAAPPSAPGEPFFPPAAPAFPEQLPPPPPAVPDRLRDEAATRLDARAAVAGPEPPAGPPAEPVPDGPAVQQFHPSLPGFSAR